MIYNVKNNKRKICDYEKLDYKKAHRHLLQKSTKI